MEPPARAREVTFSSACSELRPYVGRDPKRRPLSPSWTILDHAGSCLRQMLVSCPLPWSPLVVVEPLNSGQVNRMSNQREFQGKGPPGVVSPESYHRPAAIWSALRIRSAQRRPCNPPPCTAASDSIPPAVSTPFRTKPGWSHLITILIRCDHSSAARGPCMTARLGTRIEPTLGKLRIVGTNGKSAILGSMYPKLRWGDSC